MNPGDEAKRQAVILAFLVAGTVAVGFLSDPDALRTVKMWSALRLKRLAQWQVDKWQKVADDAASAYNRERL